MEQKKVGLAFKIIGIIIGVIYSSIFLFKIFTIPSYVLVYDDGFNLIVTGIFVGLLVTSIGVILMLND